MSVAGQPRIVSLLPSATEIAVALGFGDNLVGRSHECDFPPGVERLPACSATKLQKGLSSLEIDRRVQQIVEQGLSVYEVDAKLLRELQPDIILTQTQCAVCAVTPRDLEEALSDWSGGDPVLLSLAPDNLSDVWDDVQRVGEALGVRSRAGRVVAGLRDRLSNIAERARRRGARPSVAAIEWIEPLMAAGNWIPELIEIAGGRSLFATAGQHSPWLDPEALYAADPDVIVLMPCGFRISQTLRESALLVRGSRWLALSAAASGRVYAADGHHFFNRPGPRLVDSAETLAEIIHRAEFGNCHEGRGWVTMRR